MADRLADISPATVHKQVSEFLATRLNVLRHVRDALTDSQDKQKEQADAKIRNCVERYKVGDQVLLNAKNLPTNVVSAVFKMKLHPRFIGPFTIVSKKAIAYTFNLLHKLRTHPVYYFYIRMLKNIKVQTTWMWKRLAPRKLALPQAATSK